MSEEQTQAAAESTKAKRPPPEVKKVTMTDGREVEFVGKRNLNKSYDEVDNGVKARFDFSNGATYSITIDGSHPLVAKFIGHGVLQKVGDECAGVKDEAGEPDVDSMALAVESMIQRLSAGEWGVERQAGDSFSGAGVVVRAVLESVNALRAEKGLDSVDMAWVKAFLEKRLSDDKEKGGTLTRQKLYASFRAPGTKTAAIIERLEADKKKKGVAIDADAELAGMAG